MSPAGWAIIALGVWICWALFARWVTDNPRGDFETGVSWRLVRLYCRVVHHLRVEGLEHVPRSRTPGRLVIVANHTAGVDPLLVQSVCPFFIRWMMARDMRLPALEWLWVWGEVISVDRRGGEIIATREALRHLASEGAVGIFPEGNLERPARHVLPFLAGVGLIVHRSGAPVLPVLIDGTPQVDPAWSSLWRFSRAHLRFLPMVDYSRTTLRPGDITDDIRRRLLEASGWPACDVPEESARGGKGK